ncbi:MAG: tRNA preQ1(34) S-adenosylmethionine ribosyltransferase-isomerase QueA [Gammaproteobacteria bacterium]|jgi:S-adenosylmethionine:tRNA ribosyltransferase-isomerase|nr:tRNA preQ1(34) S-adenosylmethionine ribosyltransferase-isomerase QueA [Gammaproteobacteria bacterium]MBT3488985.1 tRNA preQ1(34) S-adenosylmethionine ribosyltransferase-isomerase QueA [Gammaproteobacteria bacterium]MBT3717447.1 tRNA preQ1(34) S-adenosylmethionine ribosyltransferase-isomerase QueA [Gammaproteobacteria bacterium]MBT3844615.1 tRNA preQ1(34) S-adenosylmethionine ribosyltransferase-isomerase QueA [Gammaproteobacteria bacterium]MBT3892776.1 tRNA preQ1(34) S-adenosylmethionine ribo
MRKSDFYFDLPKERIAQSPPENRGESRLLVLTENSAIRDCEFSHLLDLVQPNDLLVLNDTRVIPARLFGHKESGGKVELLVERVTGNYQLLAHVRASKAPKPGARLMLEETIEATVTGRSGALFEVQFAPSRTVTEWLELAGRMPLPPYIEREAADLDSERYQTVYARHKGAVAAPTAGLHFTESMMKRLQENGVKSGFVTLHVGAGTFQPMRAERIEEHVMHSEWCEVSEPLCEQVREAQAAGGRVVAVGTTAVRSLETASKSGEIMPFSGETDIFITPGYSFNCVDALLTNFHLPESTLMMLVTAFGGYEPVMAAYQHAIEQHYRFFSYGDAMFLQRHQQ